MPARIYRLHGSSAFNISSDTSIEKNLSDSNAPTPTVDVLDSDGGERHVQQLHRKLGASLKSERLQREGRISRRKILQTGKWIEREVDERRQMIGGIDDL
ncbi:hypothetical protein PHLCEN_2v11623 [Hermanssonia centrifuga]|uniref:Uncharacterized protein n=1 Tax=Hermanssonia centrifuga TaxID=98765 RepID=A0A2R6NJJ6_9APHY|nr:hypothetical protein PHLCEN_2v11623 [Hermanssonia centrifuga]